LRPFQEIDFMLSWMNLAEAQSVTSRRNIPSLKTK
jgi:hypothetical protein